MDTVRFIDCAGKKTANYPANAVESVQKEIIGFLLKRV